MTRLFALVFVFTLAALVTGCKTTNKNQGYTGNSCSEAAEATQPRHVGIQAFA